jgi:hypothetical protein
VSTDDPQSGAGLLPRHLCRVMGLNQNYTSRTGTAYHVQIEDRGPVFDDATEEWVRRVNVIAYANYGEETARIVHGRDHDFPDVRTHEHNREVKQRIQELSAEAVALLEEKETRQVARVKKLLKRYYETRDETVKREFEDANRLYPFVFARAFQELRSERARVAQAAEAAAAEEAAEAAALAAADAAALAAASGTAAAPLPASDVASDEVVYPLDPALRDLVLEIERVSAELTRDVEALKAKGAADDILQATSAKLLARARESLSRRQGGDFASRHLEMTRNSLVTTYRQVRARLNRAAKT